MAQSPGVQTRGFEIFQGAGGVTVCFGLAFHCAVQHAQLKTVMSRIAVEKAGQIAAFLGFGVADAVNDGQRRAVFFQHMSRRFGTEDRDVVGPLHGRKARSQRIMIAVRQKDANAEVFQTLAAVAQFELGFDAVIFLIVDIAGQHQKIRFFSLAKTKESLQSRECGLRAEGAQEAFLLQPRGKGLKGRVQMQIGRVDVPNNVHAQ